MILSQIAMLARPPGAIACGRRTAIPGLFLQRQSYFYSSRTFINSSSGPTLPLSTVPSVQISVASCSLLGHLYRDGFPLYRTAMANPVVQKRGRGFKSQPVNDSRRLDRPTLVDEDEIVVMESKPRRVTQNNNLRIAPSVNLMPESSGGVRLASYTSTLPAPQNEPSENTKRKESKLNVYVPRYRRGSSASEPTTVDTPPEEVSRLNFDKVTRPTQIRTFEQSGGVSLKQALKFSGEAPVTTPHIDTIPLLSTQARPSRAAPTPTQVLTEALKSLPPRVPPSLPSNKIAPSLSSIDAPPPNVSVPASTRKTATSLSSSIHAPPPNVSVLASTRQPIPYNGTPQDDASPIRQRAPRRPRAPRAPRVPRNSALQERTSRSADDQITLNTAAPLARATGRRLPIDKPPIVQSTAISSVTIASTTDTITDTITNGNSGVSIEEANEIHIEGTSTVSNDMQPEADDVEPYQLGLDERFASESSDESESVTSTLHDYEDVSDKEANKGADKEAASEGTSEVSEPEVKKRKPRSKPKATEVSDGKVYYPIAVDEEPYVPFSYEVPMRELTRLLALNEDSRLRMWSHSLYENEGKKITVEYCTKFEEFETAAQKFLNEKAVGFDMEWLARPSKRVCDNVSLIQIAKEDHIALIHLAKLKKEKADELIPPSLRALLESKDILKVGVHVGGDGTRFKKWLGIEPQGLMELSAIHHVIEYARERRRGQIPKMLISLTKLCEKYLQLPISKGAVRISDWTKPLSPSQISYAATDAYAGIRIYDALQRVRMLINPIPMLPPCVRCSDEKTKKLVQPKIYIDGVEQGTTMVSTWGTPTASGTTETFTQTSQTSEVLDWADEVEESSARSAAIQAAKAKRPAKKKAAGPLSPEMQFATEWASQHLTKRTKGTSTVSQLKAYALWHVKQYSLEETATFMDIAYNTAATYVQRAVWTDKLECDTQRLALLRNLTPGRGYHRN